jgi:hypothetical protein
MMKSALSKVGRLLTRRSSAAESGQAVIILALGFIALIAFVGIVTDVSLMFVRYSTLSRSVDSAAIAAAGQMRSDRNFGDVGIAARQFVEFHGLNPEEVLVETCQSTMKDHDANPATPNEGDKSLCPKDQRKLVRVSATINSPTVFMRLLGFPNVKLTAVALSETAVLDVVILMDVSESMLFDTTYNDWARIGMGKVYYPPRLGGNADLYIEERDQIDPLTGLQLEGAKPSAGDVLTIPASESQTVYGRELQNQWDRFKANGGATGSDNPTEKDSWIPPTWTEQDTTPILQRFWNDMVINRTHQEISDRLLYSNGSNSPIADPDYPVQVYDLPGGTFPGQAGIVEPRADCRVRFWPNAVRVPVWDDTRATYRQVRNAPTLEQAWPGRTWDGFVPTYNFYGCCNDPTANGRIDAQGNLVPIADGQAVTNAGDFEFNDLICQPFRQARDATRQFLDRIDFSRGDRVAFVTFDKMAFLIDPDGSRGGNFADSPCKSVEVENKTTGKTELTHMIETDCRAKYTLDTVVGVRAEPNSYAWNEDGGGWTAFADGLDENGASKIINYNGTDVADPGDYTQQPGMLALNSYPVRDHCPLQNATLQGRSSRYSLWDRSDLTQLQPQPPYPSPAPGLYRIMIPDPLGGTWAGSGIDARHAYEQWASCRNTNIGAALRTGSNALLDPLTTRRTGTIWVMVLLGDGAAGGSDPVRQNGRRLRDGSFNNPDTGARTEISAYADWGQIKANWEDWWQSPDGTPYKDNIRYGTNLNEARTQYGAFGLCPPGTPTARTSLTREYAPGEVARFPFCSDEAPETRHFCYAPDKKPEDRVGYVCSATGELTAVGRGTHGFAPGSKDENYECNPPLAEGETVETYNLRRGNIYDLDIGDWTNNVLNEPSPELTPDTCNPRYDVDDYARDWADYIGLAKGTGEQQLPIIFTIGFGLNFELASPTPNLDPDEPGYQPGPAGANVADYLGEELLRYIADVGDNNQIDTDYQQDYLDDRIWGNWAGDLGLRGPCEKPNNNPMQRPPGYPTTLALPVYDPLPPRTSCGNYYNAPNEAQLQLVFDDIASRMFTRLTG